MEPAGTRKGNPMDTKTTSHRPVGHTKTVWYTRTMTRSNFRKIGFAACAFVVATTLAPTIPTATAGPITGGVCNTGFTYNPSTRLCDGTVTDSIQGIWPGQFDFASITSFYNLTVPCISGSLLKPNGKYVCNIQSSTSNHPANYQGFDWFANRPIVESAPEADTAAGTTVFYPELQYGMFEQPPAPGYAATTPPGGGNLATWQKTSQVTEAPLSETEDYSLEQAAIQNVINATTFCGVESLLNGAETLYNQLKLTSSKTALAPLLATAKTHVESLRIVGCVNATVSTAPTNFSGVAVDKNTVALSWLAPASSGGASITGYKVFADGVHVGTAAANAVAFTVGSLNPSTTYTFTLVAVNSVGSSPSATISLTTPATHVKPVKPTPTPVNPAGPVSPTDTKTPAATVVQNGTVEGYNEPFVDISNGTLSGKPLATGKYSRTIYTVNSAGVMKMVVKAKNVGAAAAVSLVYPKNVNAKSKLANDKTAVAFAKKTAIPMTAPNKALKWKKNARIIVHHFEN
jgi:hypothetical protein